jgi:glyoxylase-like metal-dependent hydrolase (beta-lactamase superfamily II)
VSYSIRDQLALFSGDVLFQGSIGRTDLPGGDMQTLLDSIAMLMDKLPLGTAVFPGHMGVTTLEAEAASNPFLANSAKA